MNPEQGRSDSEVAAPTEGQQIENGAQPEQQQPPQRSWGGMLKSIIFQMVIFYFISSYFRGSKTPAEDVKGPDGKPLPLAGINLFRKGQKLVSERIL